MLHTTIALSFASRITSYSISLYPAIDFSIKHCVTGDKFNPFSTVVRKPSSSSTIPPPVPPNVKAGRTIIGYPISFAKSTASSTVLTITDSGIGWFNSNINSRNMSRSSAFLMAAKSVPKISTPHSLKIPSSANSTTKFNPVCPPSDGKTASGRSFRIILLKNSFVKGSM